MGSWLPVSFAGFAPAVLSMRTKWNRQSEANTSRGGSSTDHQVEVAPARPKKSPSGRVSLSSVSESAKTAQENLT